MHLLLTGATGFIGQAVLRLLQERPDVQVIALFQPGADVERLRGCAATRSWEGSLDLPGLIRTDGIDAVLHIAWYVHPSDYLDSPGNIEALALSGRLFRAAVLNGCKRVVGVGSGFEYGSFGGVRREDLLPAPRSLYAGCKVGAAFILEGLGARHGCSAAWARVFHLFGPGEHPARLMPQVIQALREGRNIDLTSGEQLRDYLHVDDVAGGLLALLGSGLQGPVNICSGQAQPLRDTLLCFGRQLGRPELLRFGARANPPGDEPAIVGSSERLRSVGWKPRFDLDTAVADTLASALGRRA